MVLHQPQGIWRLLDRWFGGWRKKKLQKLEEELQQIPNEVKKLQKQLSHAVKILQIQEYAKVLSLVLEICLFPARYAWVNEGKGAKTYEEQVWYG